MQRLAICANGFVRIFAGQEAHLLKSTTIGFYTGKATHFHEDGSYAHQLILAWLKLSGALPHISIYETELNFLSHYFVVLISLKTNERGVSECVKQQQNGSSSACKIR